MVNSILYRTDFVYITDVSGYTAIAEFHQPAGGSLIPSRRRHAGSAGEQADLVLAKFLGARVIHVAVERDRVGAIHNTASGLGRSDETESIYVMKICPAQGISQPRPNRLRVPGSGTNVSPAQVPFVVAQKVASIGLKMSGALE